jgi:hypothetical protein
MFKEITEEKILYLRVLDYRIQIYAFHNSQIRSFGHLPQARFETLYGSD